MKKLLIPSLLAALILANAPNRVFADGGLSDWPTHSESWGAWQRVTFEKDGKTVQAWCHHPECQRDNGWWTKVKDFFGADTSVTTPLYNIDRKNEKIPGQPLGTVFYSYDTDFKLTMDKAGAKAWTKDGKFSAAASPSNEASMSAQGSGMWVLSPKATKEAEEAAGAAKKKKGEPANSGEEKKKKKEPKSSKPKTSEPIADNPPKKDTPETPASTEKSPTELEKAKKAAEGTDQAKGTIEGNTRTDNSGGVVLGKGDGKARENLTLQQPQKSSVDGKPVPPPDCKDKSNTDCKGPDTPVVKKPAGPPFGDKNFKYNVQTAFKGAIVGGILGLIFGGPVGLLIGLGVGFAAGYAMNMAFA